jgi:hypothetical protein
MEENSRIHWQFRTVTDGIKFGLVLATNQCGWGLALHGYGNWSDNLLMRTPAR